MVVGILDGCASDGALLIAVKEKLWQYELDSIMLTALKQDFNKILDGWNTAAKVARILVYAHFFGSNYTVSQKKVPTFELSVTLSNHNQYSKCLYYWKVYEICYKTHATLPTFP